MIVSIGLWVLREACREASAWRHGDGRLASTRLSVNVSPHQLHAPGFVAAVQATLRDTGFDPHRLTLELTEGVLLASDASSLEQLHQLRALGVRLAIDDFGTGFANLSYLQDFPLDQLKMDRSFVRRLSEGGDTAVAVSILTLASALRLSTVAEGIETAPQRDQLRALGCTYGQGYLFSRPLSGDQIASLLVPLRGEAVVGLSFG
jgi:EAL domain-containing protein (putative c-di-GMP-specific phosphodiesterase class I)